MKLWNEKRHTLKTSLCNLINTKSIDNMQLDRYEHQARVLTIPPIHSWKAGVSLPNSQKYLPAHKRGGREIELQGKVVGGGTHYNLAIEPSSDFSCGRKKSIWSFGGTSYDRSLLTYTMHLTGLTRLLYLKLLYIYRCKVQHVHTIPCFWKNYLSCRHHQMPSCYFNRLSRCPHKQAA